MGLPPEDRTASFSPEHRAGNAFAQGGHPNIEGFTLVTTPPLPPFFEGGFGRVYRAVNREGLLVAVKVLRPGLSGDVIAKLWAEECALSRAFPSHDHVVRFFPREIARWPDGTTCEALVMEWLEGARGLIRYCNENGLDKEERIQLLLQAVEGVAWMHSHGTPHCDLKSENMLVVERLDRATVKVTDFGGTRSSSKLDHRNPAYTPSRASPEVMGGDPAAITTRADVFSLCKECAELVGLDRLGLRDRHLEAIVARGTRTEPRERFADAAALATALRQWRPSAPERWTRALERWLWPGRTRSRVWLAAALLIAIATLAAWRGTTSAVVQGLLPNMPIASEAPEELNRVLVIRERSALEIEQLASRIGIPGVSSEAPISKRPVWGAIIEHLAQCQPDAIVVDIGFRKSPDSKADAAIVEQISRAAKRVPVVVSVATYLAGPPDEHAEFPLAQGIAAAGVSWGCFSFVPELPFYGDCLVVAQKDNAQPRLPLAVVAAATVMGKNEGRAFDVHMDVEGPQLSFLSRRGAGVAARLADAPRMSQIEGNEKLPPGIDLRDMVGIYPLRVPSDVVFAPADKSVLDLTDERGAWKSMDLRGRTVIIAAHLDADYHQIGERVIPGVWIHAAAIQSLLNLQTTAHATWWLLVPLASAAVVGFCIGTLLLRMVCMAGRVPVPLRRGRWTVAALPASAILVRWCWVATGVVVVAIGVPVAVILMANAQHWRVPYHPGLYGAGLAAGAFAGAAAVVVLAWIGCVRRANCLDRIPNAR